MNQHGLNAATLNGSNLDVVQRSAIAAVCVAHLGAGGGRVWRRGPVEVEGTATASPGGRLFARAALRVFGQAAIHQALTPRVYTCYARISAMPRLRARSALSVVAQAQMPGVLTTRRRAPVSVSVAAVSTGLGDAKSPTGVFAPVTCFALADVAAGGYVLGGLSVSAQAQAQAVIATTVRRRAPVAVGAEAQILVHVSGFRRIPFDEPAPAERTFRVPAIQTLFYAS